MSAPALNPAVAGLEPPPIPAVQRAAARYGGAHGPFLDLSQAVPGHPPPPALLDALGEAARDPALLGYGPIEGEPALREAWAADLTRAHGLGAGAVSAEDVLVTAGCNQAFVAAALALAGARDELVLIGPAYFNHRTALAMLGIGARTVEAREADGFVPDPERVARAIGPATRAVVAVSPSNPTGVALPEAVLGALLDLCEARGVALVLDETYRDFLPPGRAAPHRLFEREWRDALVSLSSFSKSLAVPGHRLGTVLAGPAVRSAIVAVQDNLQICAPRAAQAAVARALLPTVPWREANRRTVAERAARLETAFAGLPDWRLGAVGAYFAWVRHPFEAPSTEVAERLAGELGVATLPGRAFGEGHDRWLRAAFANVDAAGVEAAVARLGELGR